jgi:Amt family ammonium transporter
MSSREDLLDVWKLICSSMVIIGLAGLTLMEAGYTRKSFSVNLLLKNYYQFATGIIAWYLLGFGFALGDVDSNYIGEDHFGGEDWESDRKFSQAVFYGLLGIFTLFIINLAFPERVQFWIYPLWSGFFMIWVYPVIVAWGWGGGWLKGDVDGPFVDAGGSVAVHILAGSCALGALLFLRQRESFKERAEKEGKRIPYFEARNFPYVLVGSMLFVIGLIGANMGRATKISEAAQAFFNTMLAGCSCSFTALAIMTIWNRDLEKYYFGLVNGFIAGIVSVSGMVQNCEPYDAFSMGIIVAPVFVAVLYLVPHAHGDDVGAVLATHLAAGILGTFGTGFFDNDHGTWHDEAPGTRETLGTMTTAFAVVTAWGFFWSVLFFGFFRAWNILLISKEDDKENLKNIDINFCSYVCSKKEQSKQETELANVS